MRLDPGDIGPLGELLDQPARDAWREQRLAGRDDAHRGEQLVGQRVLEQETAGACTQRAVDVLVEIERGEDQHARRDARVRDRARGFQPVHLGHADVHEHDVGAFARHDLHCLDPVGCFADHVDVGCRTEKDDEPAPDERLVVGDGDADHSTLPYGSRASTRNPPPAAGPASRLPA